MLFFDVAGQHGVKEKLKGLVENNRLSHSLLFLGKEGGGALQLALAFSQYIVCETNATTNPITKSLFGEEILPQASLVNDSCGICPSCKKASMLMHPDIHFSFPTITKAGLEKPVCNDFIVEWRSFIAQTPFGNAYDWLQCLGAENKQGNITAHECEAIIKKLNLKSFESGYKILIQWLPEYLGNSGNKLLKLVEEPPEKTLFIFVAEDESKILPTILSRTQLIKINPLQSADIQQWLISTQAVPKEKAISLAPLAQGNLREAFQLLHHGDEDWQSMLREWLNAILKNGPASQVKWVEETSKLGREKQKQFLMYFIHLLSSSVHIANTGRTPPITEEEADFATRLLKLIATDQIEALVDELNKSIYYIERNANAKILFMALSIKIYHIIKDKSVILTY